MNKSWIKKSLVKSGVLRVAARFAGRGAAINYEFVDMVLEVPRETGSDAPRAVWRLSGTLRITTTENASRG